MDELSDPKAFVASVESFSGRTFRFRDEIASLVGIVHERNMRGLFEDIVFNAKFISNALNILRKTGTGNQETAKLSAELAGMTEKTVTLLRTVVKEAPEEFKQRFTGTFLAGSERGMNELIALLYELHWVKNYFLDMRHRR